MKAPIAQRKDYTHSIHDHDRSDPYFWMRDRENPEVIAYLEQENSYLKEKLKHTDHLQQALFEEITGRIQQTDMSVPYLSDGWYFYNRFEEGKEYPIFCRKNGSLEAAEEILLNANEMASDSDYYQVGGLSLSTSGQLMACGEDRVGRRQYTIRFKDLTTGNWFPETIPNTTGGAVWAADNQTVFYTVKDESLRASAIFRHQLGTDTKEDVEIYKEEDDTFNTFVYKSKSKAFLLIGSESTMTSEYQYLDVNDPKGSFTTVLSRERGHEYSVAHFKNDFYILTNDQAKNFRLVKMPVATTGKEDWEEVIPHQEGVLLEDLEIFQDYLVIQEKRKGLNHIRIRNWASGEEHELDFGETVYTAYLSTNREFNAKILRFGYTSLTTPNTIFDYDMGSREKVLLKQQEVVGAFSSDDYVAERQFAVADDGTEVPISLVRKKGLTEHETAPLLLYGYGSYGASMDPYFSTARLSLLDRGFVFAIAHIRGGEDLGRDWYESGKLLQKKNTFTDFIACAEHLIKEGITTTGQLYGMGGSAGGLLIGAVANMRPTLFQGLVAQVPFVDVVTTMLDDTIPLTTGEYDEWGNPNTKAFYEYMLSYSPYDNVAALEYPAMLITSGLHDSQVQYWEPTKWVAMLRHKKVGEQRLYLNTNMEAGHSGASGRFQRFKEVSLEYAFLLDLAGKGN